MEIIGTIHTDFSEKFGIPRQSGIVSELEGQITFNPIYRQPEAFKGLENYDYIWVIFGFHQAKYEHFSATVKPPKLGGNTPMGVFATRSPFRPNSLGLSCVKLKCIEYTVEGPVLHVLGADMVDGTPIYDIKPYLPYTDSHPNAKAGFSDTITDYKLDVILPSEIPDSFPKNKLHILKGILAEDPRPGYKTNDTSEFGLSFACHNIRFAVIDRTLTVNSITKL